MDLLERPVKTPSRRPARRAVAVFGIAAALIAGLAIVGVGGEARSSAVVETTQAPGAQAWSGILMDRSTGTVLWKKDPDRRLPPASLTKVMTAIIVLERVHRLDSLCSVPTIVGREELGNVVGLRPGQHITVRQALRALIVKSANDACVTLACRVSGSETAFVRLMNAKARALGLDDTRFVNSRGKPVPGHYMSADDLARLGRYVMRNAEFRDLCRRKTAVVRWEGRSVTVESHNRLLDYAWADGIKTGAAEGTGKCLLGSGTPGLRPLIVATLHQPSRTQEVRDAVALLKWGSALYVRRTLVMAGDVVATVPLESGGAVRCVAADSLVRVVRSAARLRLRTTLPVSYATLPADDSVLGRVTYRSDGLDLGSVRLLAGGLVSQSPPPGRSAP